MQSEDKSSSAKKSRPSEALCSSSSSYSSVINLSYLSVSINSEDGVLKFLQHYGLVPKQINCPKCKSLIEKVQSFKRSGGKTTRLVFRCYKKGCNTEISARNNTFFENTKTSLKKTLILTYLFTRKTDYKSAIFETSGPLFGNETTSTETVADLYSYCREVCLESLLQDEKVKKIGGKGFTVEIDEAQFGKRKCNKGRVVEGQWVLGGICRETRECFLLPVVDRSAEILIALIVERVKVGTIIHTDETQAYSSLSEHGFIHRTVNHSQNFVDPDSGVHTNLIENTWWCLKRSLPSSHCGSVRDNFGAHFAEFLWRHKNKKEACLFTALLRDIQKFYPGL